MEQYQVDPWFLAYFTLPEVITEHLLKWLVEMESEQIDSTEDSRATKIVISLMHSMNTGKNKFFKATAIVVYRKSHS